MMLRKAVLQSYLVRGCLVFSTAASACTPKKSEPQPAPSTETSQQSSPSAASNAPANEGAADEKQKPTAKEARQITEALPKPEAVQKLVNPKGRAPYEGPTGSVVGIVRSSGDPAPRATEELAKIEDNCGDARSTFASVFREGPGRELADVLVAVTEYDGYVPAEEKYVVVNGKGCAWDRRTVVLTYGQGIEVRGLDNRPYVPELLGQPMPAQLFVLPSAPPVRLPPQKPGRFTLVDSMRLFNRAEVFVLPYATHDVTERDGTFEIKRIPVGKVKISALLPVTMAVVEQEVVITENQATKVELTLPFNQAAYDKRAKARPLEQLKAP